MLLSLFFEAESGFVYLNVSVNLAVVKNETLRSNTVQLQCLQDFCVKEKALISSGHSFLRE